VAILNTTLRTIGRPAELRTQLFGTSLAVRTLRALPDPDHVFGGLPGVTGWKPTPSSDQPDQPDQTAFTLSVSDPGLAAPAVTRALVNAGADVLSIGEARHSLEDVYLELIDEDREAAGR
jgi:ABC-2 type transport system ATP-binding protein